MSGRGGPNLFLVAVLAVLAWVLAWAIWTGAVELWNEVWETVQRDLRQVER